MDLDDLIRDVVSSSDEGTRGYFRQAWLSSALDTLVQARRASGLTQAQIADRLGTTQSSIARMERDDGGGISLRRFVDYAIACGVVPNTLVLIALDDLRTNLLAASAPQGAATGEGDRDG